MPTPSPKGKAISSSVGNADTFPKGEGNNLFRRQSRHLPQRGKAIISSVGKADTFPEGKAFCREGKTCIVKLFGNVLFSRFFSLIIPAVLCYDMLILLYS